jgi:N6-L-threonylcarbamoyladenine synthase
MNESLYLLAIESSCDETSASVLHNDRVLSNIIATQKVHEKYGGVVPELASRAHQQHIVPVVQQALHEASVTACELNAIAYTQGPGLMGALLVGASFAKSIAMALNIPLVPVHHMRAHIMAHFIRNSSEQRVPDFPFMCLTVSGGHTQLVLVNSPIDMQVVGETIDDAAGEALDKAAKVMGLPYPGGPHVDRLAKEGDAHKYTFTSPNIAGFNYSFSGLKTNLLYFLRDRQGADSDFVKREMNHICASYQHVVTEYLLAKLEAAAIHYNVRQVALAGGVSANSALRSKLMLLCERRGWEAIVPPIGYCTDNAAMIGISGYYQLRQGHTGSWNDVPRASWPLEGSLH